MNIKAVCILKLKEKKSYPGNAIISDEVYASIDHRCSIQYNGSDEYSGDEELR